MIRQAFIDGGVVYHHGNFQADQPLEDFAIVDLGKLTETDLNEYDLVVVPRSADGEVLRARRYQFARFLDSGGVLVAFGELWTDWFPGCRWQEECAEDILEPVIVAEDHPIVAGYSTTDLHWHPARERWCCHGHLIAPPGAEVLVTNQRGDAWTYIDRETTNGVILASTNLDPDTHTFHGVPGAREFFDRVLAWAREEAAGRAARRERVPRKIAGLYSGVHFQRAFYADAEFGPQFSVLPAWELAGTNLGDFAALWIPRESNQNVLHEQRDKIREYLEAGGTVVCFDEVNQPWLPAGEWELRSVDLDAIRVGSHPIMRDLTPDDVRWHSHGAYSPYPNAEVLIDAGNAEVMLFLDERTFRGQLLAGTLDPDCHAGFGTETTRPLLRAILEWVRQPRTVGSAAD